jgi:hypothetical protein
MLVLKCSKKNVTDDEKGNEIPKLYLIISIFKTDRCPLTNHSSEML